VLYRSITFETAELISCDLSKKLVGRGCDVSLREFKINAAVLNSRCGSR